jgi:hypothetical protein
MKTRVWRTAIAGMTVLALVAGCGGSGGAGGAAQEVFPEKLFNEAAIADGGKQVLFTDGGARLRGRLHIRDLTGGKERPFLRDQSADVARVRSPRWLADGRVLFLRLGDPKAATPDVHVSIAAADGSGFVDLPEASGGQPPSRVSELSPTADGKGYFYAATPDGAGSGELHVAALDGSSDRIVATAGTRDFSELVASSDGKHLAVVRGDGSESFNPRHLFILDTDGKVLKDVGPGQHPAWSPDGSRLAFDAPAGKGSGGLPLSKVATVDADGGRPLDAGKPHAYISETALLWSSVGKILFVYEGYDHQYALWSVPEPKT